MADTISAGAVACPRCGYDQWLLAVLGVDGIRSSVAILKNTGLAVLCAGCHGHTVFARALATQDGRPDVKRRRADDA